MLTTCETLNLNFHFTKYLALLSGLPRVGSILKLNLWHLHITQNHRQRSTDVIVNMKQKIFLTFQCFSLQIVMICFFFLQVIRQPEYFVFPINQPTPCNGDYMRGRGLLCSYFNTCAKNCGTSIVGIQKMLLLNEHT